MKVSYPAVATSALFTALLILDLSKKQTRLFINHLLFASVAVFLMIYLSQVDADYVAWGLLAFPLLLLSIGLLIGYYNPAPGPAPLPAPSPTSDEANSCYVCGQPISMCACTQAAPAKTETCGSGTGKTQCINTASLTSA